MKVFPAIDVLGGKAVRLLQGDYDKSTVYDESPVKAAERWISCGTGFLHIVDLDGARYGKSYVTEIINEIKAKHSVFIQTGGGVRCMTDIEQRIAAGADRVIVGTAAVDNPELVKAACEKYGDKIAVGIDAKDGYVAIKGWKEITDVTAAELALKMKGYGVGVVIYTDISKDGMMGGINAKATGELIKATGLSVIASGGVSSMADLKAAEDINAYGIIIGKALYNGALDLKEVFASLKR